VSYAICRVQKIKGSAAVTGLQIHNRREREHSNTNPDINREKSKNNYALVEAREMRFNELSEARIRNAYTGSKSVRKDAVRVCEALFTSDSNFFDGLALGDVRLFFHSCLNWAKERFGEDNIFSATVHMDEQTPHLHVDFVPLTADGRLSAKDVLGDKYGLQRMQDDFYEKVGKPWGLDRGSRAELDNVETEKPRKHRETAEYKAEQRVKELNSQIIEREKQILALGVNIDELETKAKELEGRILKASEVENVKEKGVFGKRSVVEVNLEDWRDVKATAQKAGERLKQIKALKKDVETLTSERDRALSEVKRLTPPEKSAFQKFSEAIDRHQKEIEKADTDELIAELQERGVLARPQERENEKTHNDGEEWGL
jgi:hypothetical protein